MSPIDPRLQEALDGERDPCELPTDLREAYDQLIEAAHLVSATPQLSVATRVMAEIRHTTPAYRREGPVRRTVRWLGKPRAITLRLRPLWTLALAAGLTAILLLPWGTSDFPQPGVAEGVASFVGHFPGAHSVEEWFHARLDSMLRTFRRFNRLGDDYFESVGTLAGHALSSGGRQTRRDDDRRRQLERQTRRPGDAAQAARRSPALCSPR